MHAACRHMQRRDTRTVHTCTEAMQVGTMQAPCRTDDTPVRYAAAERVKRASVINPCKQGRQTDPLLNRHSCCAVCMMCMLCYCVLCCACCVIVCAGSRDKQRSHDCGQYARVPPHGPYPRYACVCVCAHVSCALKHGSMHTLRACVCLYVCVCVCVSYLCRFHPRHSNL